MPAGEYAASLEPGWRLEQIDGDWPTPVEAALASVNPVEFDVIPGERTSVPLQFQVGADVVDTSTGYDITLDVEKLPATRRIRRTFIGDWIDPADGSCVQARPWPSTSSTVHLDPHSFFL